MMASLLSLLLPRSCVTDVRKDHTGRLGGFFFSPARGSSNLTYLLTPRFQGRDGCLPRAFPSPVFPWQKGLSPENVILNFLLRLLFLSVTGDGSESCQKSFKKKITEI